MRSVSFGRFFSRPSVVALPSVVLAQSVAGTVRDSSGAVLPGVTVEAASPALIERTRSVVTDANGQYQIIDLRPGTYVVTFTLPGFTTVVAQGARGERRRRHDRERGDARQRGCRRRSRSPASRRSWTCRPARAASRC